jgi:hypothetical protein
VPLDANSILDAPRTEYLAEKLYLKSQICRIFLTVCRFQSRVRDDLLASVICQPVEQECGNSQVATFGQELFPSFDLEFGQKQDDKVMFNMYVNDMSTRIHAVGDVPYIVHRND